MTTTTSYCFKCAAYLLLLYVTIYADKVRPRWASLLAILATFIVFAMLAINRS
jgi:hypothetical protein